jgi:WD40 repeat protein
VIEHSSPISGIAAYQNKYIATAGYDNQVILWDQSTGSPLNRVLHDHLANQCAFNSDGSLLVTSSSDYTARVWSVPELRLLAVLNDQEDDVEMSVFHPARPLIATAARDHLLRVYDATGQLIQRFSGHTADVISVEWAAESDELITSSDDGTVKRWSLATGQLLEDIDLGGVETDTVVVNRHGTIYAGNDDGEIVVIGDDTKTTVEAHSAGIKRLVLNSAQDLLVSLSYDRTMLLWEVTPEGIKQVDKAAIPDDVWPRSCAFTAGTTIVFSTFGASYRTYDYAQRTWREDDVNPTYGINAVCLYKDKVYTVGDAGIVWCSGEEVARTGSLCNFLVPFGPFLVTGGQLGKVIDALTGRVLYQHKSPLNCGAAYYSGDRERIIVGTYTGEGVVFELDKDGSLRHVQNIRLHEGAVKGVAASGPYIFSVCADTSVAWHDTQTLDRVDHRPGAHDRIANGCASLGEGRFASVGRDLKLRIWSADRTCRTVPTSHPNSIKCVAATSSGAIIATGSYHGHVKLYDSERDQWITDARPTTAGISSLSYDENRQVFLASSYDGTVYEITADGRA